MLELFVRGIVCGGLLAAAISILRGGREPARLAGALFCVATCGFVIHTSKAAPGLVGPLAIPAWLLSAGGTSYFWMFGMALFSDARPRWVHAAPVLVMTMIVVIGRLLPDSARVGTDIIHNLFEVILVGHVLVHIWRERRSDLVEARLRLRRPFLTAVGGLCIVLSGFDVAWSLGVQDPWIKTAQSLALAGFVLAGVAVLTEGRRDLFDRAPRRDPVARSRIGEEDPETLARLTSLLEDADYWREPGLTLERVAAHLKTPEYRLRAAINRRLGYRNFPDFLNAQRIALAKQDLTASRLRDAQISTIAFDLGYASLGPFNRAFRAATGMTPTEWRVTHADS